MSLRVGASAAVVGGEFERPRRREHESGSRVPRAESPRKRDREGVGGDGMLSMGKKEKVQDPRGAQGVIRGKFRWPHMDTGQMAWPTRVGSCPKREPN